MDVLTAIKKRRSVRSYQDKPISEKALKDVLNAARLAPSARNDQNWKFVAVKKQEIKSKLVEAANNQKFVGEAPVVIAGVSLAPDDMMSCDVPPYAVDLGIAMDHITLAAVEKGLGTCWIGAYDQEEVKDILNIPEEYKVVCLMPLGYPADSPGEKSRKDFEEVVSYNKFEE